MASCDRYKGVKVLVVAKGRSLRTMVGSFLMLNDMDVREAATSTEALREIDSGFQPDIVLSGYERPGIDEEALFRALRKIQASELTPIVVMAGREDLDRQQEWRSAGATCWIGSPFSSKGLLEIMGMVLFKGENS